MSFNCIPIGVVENDFKTLDSTPVDVSGVTEKSVIRVFPEYKECIEGMKDVASVFVLCWLDKSKRDVLSVPSEGSNVGVFCTRSAERPNPVSLSVVQVSDVAEDSVTVIGLDVMDKTPVLDMKPWMEGYDTE